MAEINQGGKLMKNKSQQPAFKSAQKPLENVTAPDQKELYSNIESPTFIFSSTAAISRFDLGIDTPGSIT
jgi:hypothetical protein